MDLVVVNEKKNKELELGLELAKLKSEYENTLEYQMYLHKKNEYEEMQRQREELEEATIQAMLKSGIDRVETKKYRATIKNVARDKVEVIDINDVPQEYIRVKKEVDKIAVMKQYRENGIFIQGIDIVKEDKFKLEIKEIKI